MPGSGNLNTPEMGIMDEERQSRWILAGEAVVIASGVQNRVVSLKFPSEPKFGDEKCNWVMREVSPEKSPYGTTPLDQSFRTIQQRAFRSSSGWCKVPIKGQCRTLLWHVLQPGRRTTGAPGKHRPGICPTKKVWRCTILTKPTYRARVGVKPQHCVLGPEFNAWIGPSWIDLYYIISGVMKNA